MSISDRVLVLVVCFTIMVVFLVIGGNVFHKKYQIASAIKSGVDPIEASIAMSELSMTEMVIYLTKKAEKGE